MPYFVLVTLCLLVGAAGFLVRKQRPPAGNILLSLACLGLVASLAWQLYRFGAGSVASPVDRSYAAVAYHLGYEVLGGLRGVRGTIGIVLPPETRSNQQSLDTAFDTLARVLSPLPDLKIEELPLQASPRQVAQGTIPLPAFERALKEAPEALAYVSFVGLPEDAAQLSLWSRPKPPPLFVFDPSGATNWLAPLKAGHLKRVVVRRPTPERDQGSPRTAGPPDEIFQRLFLWVTPANAEDVAAAVRAGARKSN